MLCLFFPPGFGTTTSTGGLFGQTSGSLFGAKTTASLFGTTTTPASSGFGGFGTTGGGLFGNTGSTGTVSYRTYKAEVFDLSIINAKDLEKNLVDCIVFFHCFRTVINLVISQTCIVVYIVFPPVVLQVCQTCRYNL